MFETFMVQYMRSRGTRHHVAMSNIAHRTGFPSKSVLGSAEYSDVSHGAAIPLVPSGLLGGLLARHRRRVYCLCGRVNGGPIHLQWIWDFLQLFKQPCLEVPLTDFFQNTLLHTLYLDPLSVATACDVLPTLKGVLMYP